MASVIQSEDSLLLVLRLVFCFTIQICAIYNGVMNSLLR